MAASDRPSISSVRPLAVWGWRPAFAHEIIEHDLGELGRLGFGGVIVAARDESGRESFLGPEWLEAMRGAEAAARSHGMELWLEVPLSNLRNTPVALPSADRRRFLRPSYSGHPNPGIRQAAYAREDDGAFRLMGGDENGEPADLELRVSRDDGPDCFEPALTQRFIRRAFEPVAELFQESGGGAFRGFMLGDPDWEGKGAPWSDALMDRVRSEGFDDPQRLLASLFYPREDRDHEFIHAWRRAVVREIQASFAEPLLKWTRRHGLRLVGPPEPEIEQAFPSWAFGVAGAERRIRANAAESPEPSQRLARLRSSEGFFAFGEFDSFPQRGPIGVEALRWVLTDALSCGQGRAVLDWVQMGASERPRAAKAAGPLSDWLAGNRGVRELNTRLAGWTAVGSQAEREARILVLHPRTSLWRAAYHTITEGDDSPPARKELERLGRLLGRLETLLRAMSFDYDLWDERDWPEPPMGIDGTLRFGGRVYEAVILPGSLNLERRTWHALSDFAATGGSLLALERFPSRLNGRRSPDLLEWARRFVDRFETLDGLQGRLQHSIDRPVGCVSLGRGEAAPVVELRTLSAGPAGPRYIVARNPDYERPARGLIEVEPGPGESVDEIDLDSGDRGSAPGLSRFESSVSLEASLAPGQARLFRVYRAPDEPRLRAPAEEDAFLEMPVAGDWSVSLLNDNLMPLSEFDLCLPGLPWIGSLDRRNLPAAMERQRRLSGSEEPTEVWLRAAFRIAGDLPDLDSEEELPGLWIETGARLKSVGVNGATVSPAELSSVEPRAGFTRFQLPDALNEGENSIEARLEWPDRDRPFPPLMFLGGMFGLAPDGGWERDPPSLKKPRGAMELTLCQGDREWLTDAVVDELSVDAGIETFVKATQLEAFERRAWAGWERRPLLRGGISLAEAGLPFYAGLIRFRGHLTLPEPGRVTGDWRRAVFDLGPARVGWAELTLNGSAVGGLGLCPFRREITEFLSPNGVNEAQLEIWIPWGGALSAFDGAWPAPAYCQRVFPRLPRIVLYPK